MRKVHYSTPHRTIVLPHYSRKALWNAEYSSEDLQRRTRRSWVLSLGTALWQEEMSHAHNEVAGTIDIYYVLLGNLNISQIKIEMHSFNTDCLTFVSLCCEIVLRALTGVLTHTSNTFSWFMCVNSHRSSSHANIAIVTLVLIHMSLIHSLWFQNCKQSRKNNK